MDIQVGDEVVTVPSLYHNGTDIGERLGKVMSTTGHIVVDLYEYESNPVKLMRNEIDYVAKKIGDNPEELEMLLGDLES